MKRFYGGPVSGESYWPRPEISNPMVRTLVAGESIGLFGLRRTGKSSLLLEIQRALKAENRTAIYVDVQGSDRIEPILTALIQAIPDTHAGSKLATALSGPKVGTFIDLINRVRGKERTASLSPREVLHHVELMKGELIKLIESQRGSLVLLIDELPYLVIHMLDGGLKVPEINSFLATLRSWRQDAHLPMLLSGSMGLQQLVRERGIARENFNDLVIEPTPPPLAADDAKNFLRALAVDAKCDWMDDTIIDLIIAETAANYPSFLQYAFGRISDHDARSPDAVRHVFDVYVRPGLDKDFYTQFDTRLARYSAEMQSAARAIFYRLEQAAPDGIAMVDVDGSLTSRSQLTRDELLAPLVEDGFARTDSKASKVAFGSPLVRAWWQSKPYRRKE